MSSPTSSSPERENPVARVLITGGAGFIGSSLAKALADGGHEVTVFDNLLPKIHGDAPDSSPLYRLAKQHARVVVGDVTQRAELAPALDGQDVVVHLAAETGTGESMYEIEHYNRVNIGGTALLLDILSNDHDRTVRKVVVASSRSIYGEGSYEAPGVGRVHPGRRDDADMLAGDFEVKYPGVSGPLTLVPTAEDATLHPSSVYGITKQTQEALVMTVAPAAGMSGVALRYQNVYGPGQSLTNPYTGILSIFSTLIRQNQGINVFEDGLESRDFVYIDDVVAATMAAITDDRADNRVFNVGSGVPTTVNEVVAELIAAFGVEVPVEVTGNYRLGDIRHNVADISAIHEALGFTPQVSFAQGLGRFVDWVQEQEASVSAYQESLKEMRDRNLLK